MNASSTSGEPVSFYFDFISPYAYLAWTQVERLVRAHGRELAPVPILFAGLLDAHGNIGPGEIPAKRTYIFKDALRHALTLGVPFALPPSHPFNPLLALRLASLPMAEGERRRLIDALFAATWAGGGGVTDPSHVRGILVDVGLDADARLAEASSPAIKSLVRSRTEAAIELGIFGVPTLVVDGELFWGLDAFAHAERRLAGKDPLTPELLQRFRDVPASAIRPRSAQRA